MPATAAKVFVGNFNDKGRRTTQPRRHFRATALTNDRLAVMSSFSYLEIVARDEHDFDVKVTNLRGVEALTGIKENCKGEASTTGCSSHAKQGSFT
jgi:hypothetical protein